MTKTQGHLHVNTPSMTLFYRGNQKVSIRGMTSITGLTKLKLSSLLVPCILVAACVLTRKEFPENLIQDIYLYDGKVTGIASGDDKKRVITKILSEVDSNSVFSELDILNPYHQSVFPLDMASPAITWEDQHPGSQQWLIRVAFRRSKNLIYVLTDQKTWMPDQIIWDIIKLNSIESDAKLTIYGIKPGDSYEITTKSDIAFATSKDEVGAPIFFQHMPLPFAKAQKNPELSKWCLGNISSYGKPPVVIEKLPVCGNCHAFSMDGRVFGMDIDYQGDKGGYVLTSVGETIAVTTEDFITWNDFHRSEKRKSMGLFSRISPDGKYVVSTVKETSFFTMIPDIDFSQFFFPVQGLIACYAKDEKRFFSLPGADDPNYVQTSPAWSPDGKYIVFARAREDKRLIDIVEDKGYISIDPEVRIDELNKEYEIHFNLYKVPFNEGKGGVPEPLQGASHNGRSNYFPRYSPDGKWIVFTQSKTGLAIQPSSQLYIVPAEGGIARRLACNTAIMNSWHSWSPNGRWIVFASKVNTPFTQLFLAHIDGEGNSNPPVLLSRFSSDQHACIAPEFVNIKNVRFTKFRIEGEFQGNKSSEATDLDCQL
jgi:hypothetical protein